MGIDWEDILGDDVDLQEAYDDLLEEADRNEAALDRIQEEQFERKCQQIEWNARRQAEQNHQWPEPPLPPRHDWGSGRFDDEDDGLDP